MGVLDSLIKFKELEDQKERADLEAIPQAVEGLIKARQVAGLRDLQVRKTEADILNIESQIEERSKGSLIDQIKEANELFTVAKNTNNAELGIATKRRIDSLLSGGEAKRDLISDKGVLDVPAVTPTEPPVTTLPVERDAISPEPTEGLQTVPKDIFGNVTPQGEIIEQQNKLIVKQREVEVAERAKAVAKSIAGKNISFTNLEKVGGSLSDLDRVFATAHEKGQIGAGKASKVRLKIAEARGGTVQDQFKEAFQFPGKMAEVLFNMIPMLTQQGDKPGSVRIMTSVLKLLGVTLPNEGTGLETGRGQMAESMRSFFRFARAAELAGIELSQSFNEAFGNQDLNDITEQDLGSWVNKIKRASARVQLSDEEQQALDSFIDNSLSSTKALIEKRGGKTPSSTKNLEGIEDLLQELLAEQKARRGE